MTDQNSNKIPFGFKWCKWVPVKCNIFMWRAFLDRIPTKTALRRRNIQVQDEECVMCGEGLDSTDHILTECGIASGVWNGISMWCRIPQVFAFSTSDLVHIFDQYTRSEIKKKALQGVIIITCWRLWKARNEMIFSNKVPKVVDIVSDVKALGYSTRARRDSVDWEKWCKFDLM
ncbi:uncharacterized protein LOC110875620 [Helianthus annuus]|uniref:uncharacterized protein LOC110875620 n=1 Tax=Helianthus annuus TaxID=4232 RepID=UPI000B8F1244|nr:uncharacterized protein LOC110875620 [Helianthus annuus]